MKKLVCMLLCLVMLLSSVSALALNYPEHSGNPATFETLEEARANGPAAIQDLEENATKTLVPHPALDGYPEGTAFVYRSANRYGGRAAGRMNTTLLVFAEQHFDGKDAALDYLKSLGVIDIIDKAIGSVVLVTPADGVAFGAKDQKSFYGLQTAMLSLKQGGVDEQGNAVTYSDAEYYGGFAYWYLIGIDGGASFLNNYVATAYDFVSRVAGMLLIGGDMVRGSQVAEFVPVYLVNAKDDVVAKYIDVNGAKAYIRQKPEEIWYNQEFPLRKVVSAKVEGEVDVKQYIQKAYNELFTEAMRLPVGPIGVYSAGTPYQGYNLDQAPFSLCDRNAVVDGWTKDGIQVTMYQDDRFDYVKAANGEYLQTWFEYLPEEVVNGTAPEGSVPLILANHGGSDDPRQYVDEIGLLELAGKEHFAIVAPEEQYIFTVLRDILPDFTRYILDKYPALDRSRVYVTGYSMGGFATLNAIFGDSSIFAAAAPQAGAGIPPTEENELQYKDIDLPIMIFHSEYDLFFYIDPATGNITDRVKGDLNRFLRYNEMDELEFDFEAYPINGFEGDRYEEKLLNGEHLNRCWTMLNDEGVPMVAFNYTCDLQHALYPEYAKMIWDYCKQFSRDLETGAVIYNPYAE